MSVKSIKLELWGEIRQFMPEDMPEIMPLALMPAFPSVPQARSVSWHDFHASTFGIYQIIMLWHKSYARHYIKEKVAQISKNMP
jgi:hypothetical protein